MNQEDEKLWCLKALKFVGSRKPREGIDAHSRGVATGYQMALNLLADYASVPGSHPHKSLVEEFGRLLEQARNKFIEVGVCPRCLEVSEMDDDGPFSHCACGTSEDYAKRPLQEIQLLHRSGYSIHQGQLVVSENRKSIKIHEGNSDDR